MREDIVDNAAVASAGAPPEQETGSVLPEMTAAKVLSVALTTVAVPILVPAFVPALVTAVVLGAIWDRFCE